MRVWSGKVGAACAVGAIAVALFAVTLASFYVQQARSLKAIEQRTRAAGLLAGASRSTLTVPFAVLSVLEFDDSAEAGRQAPLMFLDASRQARNALSAAGRFAPDRVAEIEGFRRRLDALADKAHGPLAIGNAAPGMTRGELNANEIAMLASGARLAAEPAVALQALSNDIAASSDRLMMDNLEASQWLARRSVSATLLLVGAAGLAFAAIWAAARRSLLDALLSRRKSRRSARLVDTGMSAEAVPSLPLDRARSLGVGERTSALYADPGRAFPAEPPPDAFVLTRSEAPDFGGGESR